MHVALLNESSAPDSEVGSPGPDDSHHLTTILDSARTKEEVPRMGSCGLLFYITVGAACVLGNILSYLVDAGWPVSGWYQTVTCATLPLLPALGLSMFKSRDLSAKTWHQQYCNTAGQSVAMVVFYMCFWGFVGHVAQLIIDYDCDVCVGVIGKTWPWPNFAIVEQYFPSAFWIHVATAGVIAFLAPLQFTKKIRKWNHFQAHRWIGRVVLLASCVHQMGATYLTISNLYFNRHNAFPTSRVANRVYATGFVPFNIYGWIATVQGWRSARRRRINEHAAWMYRLGTMWVIFVIEFRAIDPVVVLIDEQWGLALHMAAMFLWMIPLEIYIQKSGRFGWSAERAARGWSQAGD